MPLRKIRMIISKKNVQTTAYPTFHTIRRTNPTFSMNTGCCKKSRNPLIGWRKVACCGGTCVCEQVLNLGVTPPLSGSVDSSGSNAAGTIIGDGPGIFDVVVKLNNCDEPFTSIDNGDISVDGVAFTSSEVEHTPTKLCDTKGWQEVFKNVNGPDCCLPRNKSIQNTARSSPAQTARNGGVPYRVSGKIDKTYNHNYRQYLRKRCRIASYDLKGESSFTFPDGDGHKNVGQKGCCTTDCTGDVQSNHATYKRSNWKFRRQGAVSDSAYIAAKAFTTSNFCCCCYFQEIVWDPTGGTTPPALGNHVTQSTTGGAGVIISLTGSSTYTATLKLDDCNNVFVSGSLATLFVNGTAQGSGSFSALAPTACEEYNGRGPPERPRDPGNNPKNYNKH